MPFSFQVASLIAHRVNRPPKPFMVRSACCSHLNALCRAAPSRSMSSLGGSPSDVLAPFGDIEALMGELRRAAPPNSESEECFTLEQCWCRLMYGIGKHRAGEKETAIEQSNALRAQAIGLLPDRAGRSHEMTVRIMEFRCREAYASARHLQSIGRAEEAQVKFNIALEALWERVREIESGPHADPEKDVTEALFARYWSGNVLIGLARVALETGQLSRARTNLNLATIFLASTNDRVNRAFAHLLKGSVLRQERAYDAGARLLKRSLLEFRECEHLRFFRRSRYELALLHFNNDDYSEATKVLELVAPQHPASDARNNRQYRWDAMRLLLQARIELARGSGNPAGDAAAQLAQQAIASLDEVDEKFSPDIRAKACAVAAETHLTASRYNIAVQWANRGLQLKVVDVTDQGWLILTLVESYLGLRQNHLAATKMVDYLAIRGQIENRLILDKGERVGEKLNRDIGGFFIPFGEIGNLNVEHWKNELRTFLLNQALALESREKQAQALGVTRQALAQWIKERVNEKE